MLELPCESLVRSNPGFSLSSAEDRIAQISKSLLGDIQRRRWPSKTTLNAITLAFAIDLENEGIKVNAVTPGFTSTAFNNYEGTETVQQGAAEAVRVALSSEDPTGTFTGSLNEHYPW
jgi:hypothetical protein